MTARQLALMNVLQSWLHNHERVELFARPFSYVITVR